MTEINQAVFPKVFHKETVAMTNTLKVAEYFEKRHDNILRRIETLECSAEFNRTNFGLVEYIDKKGEKRPMFEMTKTATAKQWLLAQGYSPDDEIRQYLNEKQLRLIDDLLSENAVMIKLGLHYAERKMQLQQTALAHYRLQQTTNSKRP